MNLENNKLERKEETKPRPPVYAIRNPITYAKR